jgi:hypothetical protein
MKQTSGQQPDSGKAVRPKWVLMRDKAIHVDFDMPAICRVDKNEISGIYSGGRLTSEYVLSISNSIADILREVTNQDTVSSSMLSQKKRINMQTAGDICVVISNSRESGELSVEIIGEGESQGRIAERIRQLKSSLEQ